MSNGTKVYDFANHEIRCASVIEAIAKTEKIAIICGAGVAVATGMPHPDDTVSLSSGTYHHQMALRTIVDDCATTNPDTRYLREDKLAAYNKLMASLRIKARTAAPRSAFHQLVERVHGQQRVVQYLTTCWHGLEPQGTVGTGSWITRAHSDNRWLRCSTPTCPGIDDQDAMKFDNMLLAGQTVACPPCTQAARSASNTRRIGPPSSRFLRPAVQTQVHSELLPGGSLRASFLKAAGESDLLLVVGVSLKCSDTFALIYDAAAQVHARYGGVVYIDPHPIKSRNTASCLDFHLRVDIEECALRILRALDELQLHPNDQDIEMRSTAEDDTSDVWYEVINNDLPREAVQEQPDVTVPHCCLCALTISECLVLCRRCGDYFCHPGEYNTNGSRSCVVLTNFSALANISSVTSIPADFTCAYCWNHAERGPYPYYMRPAPRLTVQERGQPAPRMAMIVYFLDQFWPQARHLCALVAGRWKAKRWLCYIHPVKLEELSETCNILSDCPWEDNTFTLLTVYITHGLSEAKGYQVSHNTSYAPPEFFNRTLAPAQGIIMRSKLTCGILVCCGHPFDSPNATRDMQMWMNGGGALDSLIGCLNKKLMPAFLVNLVARISTALADAEQHACDNILSAWLGDRVACGHTDIIYMARNTRPLMWLFSPFSSRPLGKELPHLLQVCSCRGNQTQDGVRSTSGRKFWVVTHNASDGAALKDVVVKALCSVCRQMWVLPTEHLAGDVRCHGGLYAAIMPYFAT